MFNWVVMKRWENKKTGFTIVELLIVVVVIAILAAITIVSYNGITQRATNTAINDAAAKSKRMVEAYIAQEGVYPYTTNDSFACITVDTTCRRNNSGITPVASFLTEMNKVGSLPKSAPLASDVRGGVVYAYNAGRTIGGASAPAILSWYIKGVNSDCGMRVLASESTLATSFASVPYTVGDVGSSGLTQCVASINGPGV